MIHAAIDYVNRLASLTPRDVRLAWERRIAPTLATEHDRYRTAYLDAEEDADAADEQRNNAIARAETAEGLLRDTERDVGALRERCTRWANIANARFRDAEEAQRQAGDLRAAIAGALASLDAIVTWPLADGAIVKLDAAKGLLRATLGPAAESVALANDLRRAPGLIDHAPTVDPARLITAEEAHAAHGPLSRRGADLPAPAEPIPGTPFHVGDVVYCPTPDGWGPVRIVARGSIVDGEGGTVVGERLNDGARVTIDDFAALPAYRLATAEEIGDAIAERETGTR